jgi:mRNA-degrading endonuclease RelE of RelBE toxin-antitoxin system
MVSYNPVLAPAANRELQSLTDTTREQLTDLIQEICEYESPKAHAKTKSLEGHSGWFRIRSGDYRIICELVKPELRVYRIGKRKKIYSDIDELQDRVEV